jgi:hypothetical protein
MAFKVFLSYSTDASERAIVWRLQTLASAEGIEVFVPQRNGSTPPTPRKNVLILDAAVRRAIDLCDCVMAIITARTAPAVEKELSYALGKGTVPIVPIVERGVTLHPSLAKRIPQIFWFSPQDPPGIVEAQVMKYLKDQDISKKNSQALVGLVAIGLGMLVLKGLSE